MKNRKNSPPIETWYQSLGLALLVPFFVNLGLAGIFYLLDEITWILFLLFATVGFVVHFGTYAIVGPIFLKLFWKHPEECLWTGFTPYFIGAFLGGAAMSVMPLFYPPPLLFCLGGIYGAVTAFAVLRARRKVLLKCR